MLRTRVLTGVVLAVVVFASIFGLTTVYASLVFGLVWLVGTDEWARLVRLRIPLRVAYDVLFAAFVLIAVAFGLPNGLVDSLLSLAAVLWLVMFVLVLRFPAPVPRIVSTVIGIVVLTAAWLSFARVHGAADNGPALILTGLVIVWCADIGAFFVGRTLGKTRLAPRVSPKKTWEGVAGGVALAMLAGAAAAMATGLPLVLLIPTAGAMALISVVGDLGISMLKRYAGLKDAGVLLPGHGGILDRFDGVTAALPFFVLGLKFAHVLD